MIRRFICKTFGHKMFIYFKSNDNHKASEVKVCKRCDKVSGKLCHFGLNIDFDNDDLTPLNSK